MPFFAIQRGLVWFLKRKCWINYDVLNYIFYKITSISVVYIVKKGDTEAIRGPWKRKCKFGGALDKPMNFLKNPINFPFASLTTCIYQMNSSCLWFYTKNSTLPYSLSLNYLKKNVPKWVSVTFFSIAIIATVITCMKQQR